jgi:hypothetical protein
MALTLEGAACCCHIMTTVDEAQPSVILGNCNSSLICHTP